MKSPFLTLILSLVYATLVQAQVSFAPVDSLYYNSAGRYGTYIIGNTFSVDFNKDGFDDVLVLKGNSIYLRLNSGSGAFGEEVLLYTDKEHIYSISNFADVNNDTYPDAAIATAKGISILFASGGLYVKKHETSNAPYYGRLILADVNKDGKSDLLSSQYSSIMMHSDAATALNQISTFFTTEKPIHNFGIKDLNADNELDLIVSTYNAEFKIYFGTSGGTFNAIFSKPIASIVLFEIADLNRDGFGDITYLEWNNNLFTLIYNNSSKTFSEQAVFPDGSQPGNMFNFHLVDLKNNGTPDLVYNHFFTMAAKENNGLGQFLEEKSLFENSFMPYQFSSFNMNGDGISDILSGDFNRFQVTSFTTTGTLDTRFIDGYMDDFWDVVYHDVDADGFKDILSISRTGSLYIRWGTTMYDYTSYSKYDIPMDANYGAVTDVNGDGNDDILITQESNTNSINDILIMEGRGDRVFEQARKWKYFPSPGKPVIRDIDNDGVQNVLTYERVSNQIGWFDIANSDYNEYFFSNHKLTTQGEGIRNMVCVDIDNDGYLDLLTANAISKNFSILINNTAGNFAETVMSPDGTVTDVTGVQAFDYNLDQHQDLLVIVGNNQSTYSLQIFLNDGSGSFSYHASHSLENMYLPDRIDAMDIDADEDLDFIVSTWDYLATNVFIRENGTLRNAGSEIIKNCGQSARIYEDLNNDGKPDVFTADFIAGATFVQLNNSVLARELVETEITIEEIDANSARISLSATSAAGRLVVITRGEQFNAVPSDNYFYTSNPSFGKGSNMGVNSYVVHSGDEEWLEITGLLSSTNYVISVFEYNVNYPQVTIINYSEEAIQKSFTTIIAGTEESSSPSFTVYPNPFNSKVEIMHPDRNHLLMVYNASGQVIKQFENIPDVVDLSQSPAGLYFFRTTDGRHFKAVKY